MQEGHGSELPLGRNIENTEIHEKGLAEIELGSLFELLRNYCNKLNSDSYKKIDVSEDGREEQLKKILAEHVADLNRTGLEMDPRIKSKLEHEGGANERNDYTLVLNVDLNNGKKFTNYLSELGKDYLNENQFQGLREVFEQLANKLSWEYDLNNASDSKMIELVHSLSDIVEKAQRLEIKRDPHTFIYALKDLVEYSKRAKEKYLKEYLLAKRGYILQENSSVIFFSGAEEYKKYWEDALEILFEISKNPNAQEFRKKIIDNLKKDLLHLKGRAKRKEIDLPEERLEEYKIIMDEFYDKLENLK